MSNPLNFEYGRFREEEIPDSVIRHGFNDLLSQAHGLVAIAKILHANEIEREFVGEEEDDGKPLSKGLVSGLLCAAVQLSTVIGDKTERLGMRVAKEAKW